MLDELRKALDEVTQCFICLQPSTDPLLMHCCGQLVCEGCLTEYLMQLNSDRVICPHCRNTSFPPAISSKCRTVEEIRSIILCRMEEKEDLFCMNCQDFVQESESHRGHLVKESSLIETELWKIINERHRIIIERRNEQRTAQSLALSTSRHQWQQMMQFAKFIQETGEAELRRIELEEQKTISHSPVLSKDVRTAWKHVRDLSGIDYSIIHRHVPKPHGFRVSFRWELHSSSHKTPLLHFGDCHFRLVLEGQNLLMQVLLGNSAPLVMSVEGLGTIVHEAQRGMAFCWKGVSDTIDLRFAYLWTSDELDCLHRMLLGKEVQFYGQSSSTACDPASFITAHVDMADSGKLFYDVFDHVDQVFLIN